MVHGGDDFDLLKHDFNSLLLGKRRITLATGIGVKGQGFLKICGNAEVIYDQATRLVFVDAVNSRDGLHEVVAFHRLVDVERMHAGCIEARQPHVANDNQLQRIVVVLHPLGQ